MAVVNIKNSFLMPRLILSWCNLYPLPLVFSIWFLVKRDPLVSFQLALNCMNIVMIPLFYSETGPLSFSAFSWGRFSSPFTIFLWGESHGGWCRGWDTWWVLPGAAPGSLTADTRWSRQKTACSWLAFIKLLPHLTMDCCCFWSPHTPLESAITTFSVW